MAAEAARPKRAHTDLGNAERFAERHGSGLRWCSATSTWFVWDGRRWAKDRDDEVQRLAAATVRSIYTEASESPDKADRRALADHAKRSEAAGRIQAMVTLARSLRPIAAKPEEFDGPGTEFLLTVENGTLDLRTGELGPHRPEDFITKLAPVAFAPDAWADDWDRFLRRMLPDSDVRAYLQRAVGYTLTGSTDEQVLFFLHGPEAAGKSTFTDAVRSALGDYARTADFESFLRKRGDAPVRDDIARLHGARMVLSLEVDEGRVLAEGLVKNLTGGDTVTARHLYQSAFEFRPAFKLWLVANHRPGANAQDGALWRRIHLIPFETSLRESERDPGVKRALTTEPAAQSAILAWAVRGCLMWLRDGLGAPEAVRRATDAYRADCDQVGAFLAETFDTGAQEVPAKAMREKYEHWCGENGERPANQKRVADALRRHGWDTHKREGVRLWSRSGAPGRHRTPVSVTSSLLPLHEEELLEVASSGAPAPRPNSDASDEESTGVAGATSGRTESKGPACPPPPGLALGPAPPGPDFLRDDGFERRSV